MTELAPMFAFTGLSLTWVLSPYSCILDRELLIEWALMLCASRSSPSADERLKSGAGFVFGRMSTKTILAHLTKGSFPWFSSMLIPLALGCFLVNLPLLGLSVPKPPSSVVSPGSSHFAGPRSSRPRSRWDTSTCLSSSRSPRTRKHPTE